MSCVKRNVLKKGKMKKGKWWKERGGDKGRGEDKKSTL
jgi:hypothetical protein